MRNASNTIDSYIYDKFMKAFMYSEENVILYILLLPKALIKCILQEEHCLTIMLKNIYMLIYSSDKCYLNC